MYIFFLHNIMKNAQNLKFLVDQKPKRPKASEGLCPPDPLLQTSTIRLNPSSRAPYIYVPIPIIVNACQAWHRHYWQIWAGVKFYIKTVQDEFLKSYIHVEASFQNLALGPKVLLAALYPLHHIMFPLSLHYASPPFKSQSKYKIAIYIIIDLQLVLLNLRY